MDSTGTQILVKTYVQQPRVLRLLHTTFILLKPLSHPAVLTGIVFTQFNKTRTQGAIAFPRESLYSLNANFKSRNATPNLVHNSRTCSGPGTASPLAFPLKFWLCGAQERYLALFWGPGTAFPRVPPYFNHWLHGRSNRNMLYVRYVEWCHFQ